MVDVFRSAIELHGTPASLLCDNGAVFTATPRGGKVLLQLLHHIGIGRAHKDKPVKLLIADRDIRILDPETGELIRRLTLDPSRDYQPLGGT